MYKWCSYCQSFLGEFEPRNDYQLSHGICPSCKARLHTHGADLISRSKILKGFFTSIRSDLLERKNREPNLLLQQAREIGVTPLNLLAGAMQPLLYEIAQLQASGQLSIQHEHEFSLMIEGIFHEIKKERSDMFDSKLPESRKILIACADGNYHSFGPRLIQESLLEDGFSVTCIFPSLPFEDIIAASNNISAHIIGISVATEAQTEDILSRWTNYMKTNSPKNSRHLILGGLGISQDRKELPVHTSVHPGSLSQLKILIEALIESERTA